MNAALSVKGVLTEFCVVLGKVPTVQDPKLQRIQPVSFNSLPNHTTGIRRKIDKPVSRSVPGVS
eukprot:5209388-Amphidinium_carterae.1